jgi:hypothetical protein
MGTLYKRFVGFPARPEMTGRGRVEVFGYYFLLYKTISAMRVINTWRIQGRMKRP